jgi:TldD protein
MLNQALIKDTLDMALSTGGDFAEIFAENKNKSQIVMVDGTVEEAVSGLDYGVGIRIFYGFNAIYAYTNDTSYDNMLYTAKQAAQALKSVKKASVMDFKKLDFTNIHNIRKLPFDIDKKQKVDIMRQANSTVLEYDKLISQARITYLEDVQDVLIANSNGLWAEDRRVKTRFAIEAIASLGSEKQTGRMSPGAQMGFEFFDTIDVVDLSKQAAQSAITMIKADLCPSGKMPVVIGNAFGGVIFHEACGHGLEATAIAKEASVFTNKIGSQIASPLVTAIDDGTIANAWGSLNIDDEGVPCRKNVLIEKGILKSYMVDTLNGKKMDVEPTGSSRRQSYKYAPTSRMTNTYIAQGESKPEDIIANTEYGLYAKTMGGGSVEPATGEFNFSVLEGYMIRNGKIAEPVRGATLIGKGAEVLKNIDRVGNDLEQAQGMCGSISGSVPTNVGQPTIRVSEITVGGRKEA